MGAQEEARAAARLREAAEIQNKERQRRLEKRQLVEQTRNLQQTVSDLERQVCSRVCACSGVGAFLRMVGRAFTNRFDRVYRLLLHHCVGSHTVYTRGTRPLSPCLPCLSKRIAPW